MSKTAITLAFLGLVVGVSTYFLAQDWKKAIAAIIAASALDVFWDIVITAWEKRRGEID